jgi:serine/threonine-protein kinase
MNERDAKQQGPNRRQVVGDHYELLFELASGGMGSVHVGRRLASGGFQRLVAIKRMHPSIAEDPESAAAFQDEARIASLIQHANVVAIHDVLDIEGEQLLVMDYVDGVSLATLLGALRAAERRLPLRVALRIVVDALRGLHAAHELCDHDGEPLEVVHRDATPHNILVGADGSVRLTDFGIARAVARAVNTEPGFAKGKYTYMAPEHAFAEPLDRRADVFTMGVVAWETITGRRLWANRSMKEVARGAALGDILKPSEAGADCPAELDAVILRALAPWREDRYSTAAELADALDACAQALGGLAKPAVVADVVDAACGRTIRMRRERVRELCASAPPPEPASRANEWNDRDAKTDKRRSPQAAWPRRRLATPTTAAVDTRAAPQRMRPPATSRAWVRRAASQAVALSTLLLAVTLAAVMAGVASPPPERALALRVGVQVVAVFADARIHAQRRR